MNSAAILRGARSVIEEQDGLWKGGMDNPNGETCAALAISEVPVGHYLELTPAEDALALAIDPTTEDPYQTIVDFNDAEGTTKADVLAAFDKAIASLEASA